MPDDTIEQDIKEIKKEMVETRGLIIRTNNLINSFASDLKSIAKKQSNYEHKLLWNSAVTYIIITLLCLVGLKLIYDYAESRLKKEQEVSQEKIRNLELQLKEMSKEVKKIQLAQKEAFELYELINEASPEEVLSLLDKAKLNKFSPVEKNYFNSIKERVKFQLSMDNYYKGLEHITNKEWSKAHERLEKAIQLATNSNNPYIVEIKMQLAQVLMQLGRYEEAILRFKEILEEPTSKSFSADIYWYLAQAQILANHKDEAIFTLKRLIKNFPNSQWAKTARTKLLEIRW